LRCAPLQLTALPGARIGGNFSPSDHAITALAAARDPGRRRTEGRPGAGTLLTLLLGTRQTPNLLVCRLGF
jgi:hypothetical protein